MTYGMDYQLLYSNYTIKFLNPALTYNVVPNRNINVSYVIVGGGGGCFDSDTGITRLGAGGQVVQNNAFLTNGTSYTVNIGQGGSGNVLQSNANPGFISTFNGIVAIGGPAGGGAGSRGTAVTINNVNYGTYGADGMDLVNELKDGTPNTGNGGNYVGRYGGGGTGTVILAFT